jgi:cobalt/nickel transport system permease protein
MHIPDGFLDVKTAAATGALAAAGLGMALRQARRYLPARRVPLLGLSAAFVFAAQMLNFPVPGGTSGHLLGGVLTAALLGPSAAVIVISAVLIVQCFLFADGGITALGANVFNMALIGGVGGWIVYCLVGRAVKGLFGRIVAAVCAAWASTVLAAVACAGELATSGTIGWSAAFAAMAGVHMFIGVGEGVITALVLVAIAKVRPELLGLASDGQELPVGGLPISSAIPATAGRERLAPLVVFGLLISLGLALFVAPFACPWPDGLDSVARTLGFKSAEQPAAPALLSDYKMPGIGSAGLATSIAGATGTILVFGLAWVLARVLVPKPLRRRPAAAGPPESPD